MKIKTFLFPLLFLITTLLFFYPVLKNQIPFPGDLVVGQYAPYNSLSLDGYTPGSIPHKAQGIDVARELYPWKHFVIENIKVGSIPFWNPHQFSGQELMANFQSGTFYPLNIVFFLTNFPTGWTIFIMLIPLLSISFMYAFLRELNLSKSSSFLSGILFAFSSYMVVWIQYGNIGHTILWLPLLLLCVEKLRKKYQLSWTIIFLLASTSSLLAGYIQGYFYNIIIVLLYYAYSSKFWKKVDLKKISYFISLVLLPLFFSAFQLLPTLALFSESSRGNYSLIQIKELLNPVWYLITVLIPDFFGHPATRSQWVPLTYIERVSYFGFVPFILAIYALVTRFKEPLVKLFSIIFIISLLLTTDLLLTKYLYLLPIPVLSTTVPTRALAIFVFSGSVLAGFGFDQLLSKKKIKTLGIISSVILVFLLLLWAVVIFSPTFIRQNSIAEHMAIAKRNLFLPSAYLLGFVLIQMFFLKKKVFFETKYIVVLAVFLLTIFDLFYFFHKVTPFASKNYIYPKTPVITFMQENAGINRYWGYGSASVVSNFQMIDHTFSVEGNDPLHSRRYDQLLKSTDKGILTTDLPRMDSVITPGFGRSGFMNNKYRQKTLNILGVKYILNKDDLLEKDLKHELETFPKDSYKLVWQESPWQVYENLRATERFFLTDSYKVTTESKFFADFYNELLDESKTILLYKDPNLQKGALTNKSVSLLKYSPNEVLFKTNTNAPALLYLSDAYTSQWKVSIDGLDSELLTANYALSAVRVNNGEHTVRFYYDSTPFKTGTIIAILSILASFILLLIVRPKSL